MFHTVSGNLLMLTLTCHNKKFTDLFYQTNNDLGPNQYKEITATGMSCHIQLMFSSSDKSNVSVVSIISHQHEMIPVSENKRLLATQGKVEK